MVLRPDTKWQYRADFKAHDGVNIRNFITVPKLPGTRYIGGVVLIHGWKPNSAWEILQDRFLPYAQLLAAAGFYSYYPDIRYLDPANAPLDVLYAAQSMKSHIGGIRLATFGSSAGNLSTLTTNMAYPTDPDDGDQLFLCHLDAYGAVDENEKWGWTSARVQAIQARILVQVGDVVRKDVVNARVVMGVADRLNPTLSKMRDVFTGESHGFFFHPERAKAMLARTRSIEFFNWNLKGDAEPSWWENQ